MSKQEDMYELISSYEKSGLSQSKFCKQANIKVAKFSYWRKKWLAENESQSSSDEPIFLEISPSISNDLVPEAEINYPNGISLKLKTVNISLLQQLVNHV